MAMPTLIPFAIKTDSGALVAIDDVERGLRCGCQCPSCHGRLVAAKGNINTHYFRHHDASKEECLYAFETSVRLMLMTKMDDIETLNTPAKTTLFEGQPYPVAEPHCGIKVRHIDHNEPHASPTALYQLLDWPDFNLAIHLPAAGDKLTRPPEWLENYVVAHPRRGVLAIRYASFFHHMFEQSRPKNIDTISWMLSILSEHPTCLVWLYHPREALEQKRLAEKAYKKAIDEEALRAKQAVQAEVDRTRQAELNEEAKVVLTRLREAQITEQMRARNLELKYSEPIYCKHCNKQTPLVGYCGNRACIVSRHYKPSVQPGKIPSRPTPYAKVRGATTVISTVCPVCQKPMQKVGAQDRCQRCEMASD
ncbi:hypothetical protein OB959_12845 [Aeromonas bestiarum]|uniref:Uncharacterized protein n=1 Tax=Aeromonas bestiarum TaxID=105751 RepID=A0AAW7HXT3_9GAMM|nr:hypothetical protein [Aeromonas bestiarum]MDM5140679.1 hypothetical protein [Aeromonas bestiarum]